jgi:probable O-glycosylation ligase (exosortase A-associated)
MGLLILFFFFLIGAAATLYVPVIGVHLYYLFSLLYPQNLVSSGSAIRWPVLIVCLIYASWFFSKQKSLNQPNAMLVLMVIFLGWTGITSVLGQDRGTAIGYWIDFAKIMVVLVPAYFLVDNQTKLHMLIISLVIGAGVFIARGGLFTVLTGGTGLVLGPTNSSYFHTNEAARLFAMTMPFAYFIGRSSSHFLIRWGFFGIAVLAILATIGTGSRGGFVALAAGLAVLVWYSPHKISIFSGLALAGAALFFVMPSAGLEQWMDRQSTITEYEEDGSFQGRTHAWQWALNYAASSPIVGGGFGVFLDNGPRDSHNIYFEALGEHGYVGLFLFMLIGILAVSQIFAVLSATKRRPDLDWHRNLAISLLSFMAIYFVGGITISHTYIEYYYIVAIMPGLVQILVKRELAAENQAASVEQTVERPQRGRPRPSGQTRPVPR